MADAWETLLENSTLTPPGWDAWEHLMAQGGGGTGVYTVLVDGLEINMDQSCVDVEIDLSPIDIEVETLEYDVIVDTPEYEVEVC